MLLGLFGTLLFQLSIPPSSIAEETSQISGTVKSADSKAPLQGVKVCAIRIEPGSGVTCAETESSGDYELSVGSAGVFSVYFDAAEPGYIARTFYNEEFSSPKPQNFRLPKGQPARESMRNSRKVAG